MSGHIVYGQTLFDMGRDEEAKAVFETALTLDPENLIALKHLGDIARQAGDPEGARNWYQRVLEADPRNDEIMLVLESLGGAEMGFGAVGRAEPSSSFSAAPPAVESTAHSYDDVDLPPVTHDEASTETESAEPLVLEQSKDADLPIAEAEMTAFDTTDEIPAVEASSEDLSTEPLFTGESSEEPASEVAADELLDLEDFSIGTSEADDSAKESESTYAAETVDDSLESESIHEPESIDIEAMAAEAPIEDSAPEVAAAPEPEIELAADVILGLSDDSPEPPVVEPVSDFEAEPSHAADEALGRAIDHLDGLESFSIDEPVDSPVSASDEADDIVAPDTFATETMADLYAQQGHLESAIEIYDQLLERSPEDAELRRRANEVERQLYGAPETHDAEPVKESVIATTPAESSAAEPSAESTTPVSGGPTIRDFFRGILNGPGAPAASDLESSESMMSMSDPASLDSEGSLDILFSDEPTTDADLSAAMSLAQAFGGGGEAERRDSAALQGTPAHQATDELSLDHVFRSATPAKGSAVTGAFSLDQFFAGEPGNAVGSEGANEGAPPRSSDDIAQFNAWLSGLKKT